MDHDPLRCNPMSAAFESDSVLQRLMRPLSGKLSAELAHALLELRADEELQRRYDELAEKNTEGQLTAEERTELERLVEANDFVGALMAEARLRLERSDQGG